MKRHLVTAIALVALSTATASRGNTISFEVDSGRPIALSTATASRGDTMVQSS